MSKDETVPYTAEELLEHAAKEAAKRNIPESLRDDAIQEFVIAAFHAVKNAKTNPRRYQIIRGCGAMMNFCREEIDREQACPPECSKGAARLSFDMPVDGMAGEDTTLAEVIADPNAPIPGVEPPGQIDGNELNAALMSLSEEEREVAIRVWVREQTQDEVAADLKIHRSMVRRRLDSAKKAMESYFSRKSTLP